jgi:hypothetical protein
VLVTYDIEIVAINRALESPDTLPLIESDDDPAICYSIKSSVPRLRLYQLTVSLATALTLFFILWQLAAIGPPAAPAELVARSAWRAEVAAGVAEVDRLLVDDLKQTGQRALLLDRRAWLFLVLGMVIATIGVAGILLFPPLSATEPPAGAELTTILLARRLSPMATLLFVESVAWFFLRQYRSHVNDSSATNALYSRRLNLLMALRLAGPKEAVVDSLLKDINTDHDVTPSPETSERNSGPSLRALTLAAAGASRSHK